MTLGELAVFLVLAVFCGVLGQLLAGRSIGGFVVSALLGLVGAILGTAMAKALHAPEPFYVRVDNERIGLLWAAVGAGVVAFLVSGVQRAGLSRA